MWCGMPVERCRAAGVVPMSSRLYEQLRAAASAGGSRREPGATPSSNGSNHTGRSEQPSTSQAPRLGAAGVFPPLLSPTWDFLQEPDQNQSAHAPS